MRKHPITLLRVGYPIVMVSLVNWIFLKRVPLDHFSWVVVL